MKNLKYLGIVLVVLGLGFLPAKTFAQYMPPYYSGSGYSGSRIYFSQDSVNVNYGQSTTVTIYGGNGSYYITSNSNSNLVNAYINGNQLYISSPGFYGGGSSNITVCSSNGGSICGTIYVNVLYNNNNYNNNYNNGCYYSNGYNICPNNYNNYYTQPQTYYYPPTYNPPTYGTPSAGVYLSHIPATGISINLKMTLFFIGLFLWSAFIAYLILANKKYSV